MAQICKELKELSIDEYSQDLPGLNSLIDAQRNLKSLLIRPNRRNKKGTCKELVKAVMRKGNTLTKLYLGYVASIISPSFLTSLINLKKLSISNYESYEDTSEEIKCLQQCLAISEFPDLQ